MNRQTVDLVAEFTPGRSQGNPQCYVVDNSRREKIALIPLDIGEMPDQLRIASRIAAALSRDAARVRHDSDVWTSGAIVGFCVGGIFTLIMGLLFAAFV